MKTLLRILAMVMLTFLMLALTECAPDNDKDRVAERIDIEADKDFERERDELRQDLKKLQIDLDRRLEGVNKRLETATDDTRDLLEEAYSRLTDDRINVEETLEEVEAASYESWQDVKVAARNTVQEARLALTEINNEINDLFSNKQAN